ncbi:hypothetical protein AB9F46_35400, partial [Rhizobium leguminosarum]
KSKGAAVLLAPTVNIHRSGLNCRNFECYSEDPMLTAELAVGYIKTFDGNSRPEIGAGQQRDMLLERHLVENGIDHANLPFNGIRAL